MGAKGGRTACPWRDGACLVDANDRRAAKRHRASCAGGSGCEAHRVWFEPPAAIYARIACGIRAVEDILYRLGPRRSFGVHWRAVGASVRREGIYAGKCARVGKLDWQAYVNVFAAAAIRSWPNWRRCRWRRCERCWWTTRVRHISTASRARGDEQGNTFRLSEAMVW